MAELKNIKDRKAFNFYRSYWEIGCELPDEDRLKFYDAIFNKQFNNEETELFGLSKLAYISQRFNIEQQVNGYVNNGLRQTITTPSIGASIGASVGASIGASVQEKEKGKEKGKENNINIDVLKQKPPSTPKKKYHEDVEFLYGLYPTTCPIKNCSTGKCFKNKDTIVLLLKTKTKEELEKSINYYIDDCKKANRYLKNFSTFLANIPEYEELEPKNLTIEHFNTEWRELVNSSISDADLKIKANELKVKYKDVLEKSKNAKQNY